MKIYLFTILFVISLVTLSQNTLTGFVTLRDSEKGISNAYVFLENSSFGTTTNAKGQWTLNEIPDGKYLLVISSEGFNTIKKSIVVTSDISFDFEMQEKISTLPELVIASYTISMGKQGLKELPGSVDYLSPQELKVYQHSNVNNILKTLPGVNVQEEEGFGLRPNIGLRGSGLERSSKITLMEDGILAAPAPYAAPSAYYFPTVGRMNGVEVMKGSSQIRFGPFTTGGVINFISTLIPNQFMGKVGISGGSFGYRSVQTAVGNSYKNVGFVVESFSYGADGFKHLSSGSDTGFDKSDYQAKLRFNTNKSARNYQSITFMIGQTHEDSNETYLGLTDQDFVQSPYLRYSGSQVDNMDAQQKRYSVRHYAALPGLFDVVTTAYRNDFKRNWYKLESAANSGLKAILKNPLANAYAFDLITGSVDSDTAALFVRANNREYYSQGIQTVLNFEFQTGVMDHDLHISTRIHKDEEDRFQWEDGYAIEGGIMKLETPGTPGEQSNRITTAKSWASYVFYKLSFYKFSLTPGIRYEKIDFERADFSDVERTAIGKRRENEVSILLPGFGINHQLTSEINLFGGVHKGFSPPGNSPNTDSEESINYEVGIRKFGKGVNVTAVIYLNDYKNLLGADLAAAGGSGSGDLFNAGEALTKGLELQIGYDASRNKGFSLPVNVTYTYTNAKFTSNFESDFDEWGEVGNGFQLPYIATHQFNFSASLQHKNFGLNLSSGYQSALRTSPGSGEITQENKIDGFMVANAAINVFLNEWTTFNFSVTNLFDNKYEVARRPAGLRPGMPRVFKVGVNVTL